MSDSTPPPNDALTAATQMVKNGRLDQARETLMQYLVKNPSSEQAWLLMSYVLPDPAKQRDCLERVLKINPNNTVAQSKLAHLLGRRTEELFKRQVEPPAPMPIPQEPVREPEPEPEPPIEPAAEPARTPEPPPAHAAVIKPTVIKEKLAPLAPSAASSKPLTPAEMTAAPRKGSIFSGKGSRWLILGLVVLILIIIAVVLFLVVIGPMIQTLATPPTPTPEPVAIPTYPPEWTQTLTATMTLVPPTPTHTPTHTLTETLPPSETTIP